MLSSATKAAANVTKASAENDLRSVAQDAVNEGKDALNSVSDYASEAGQKVRGALDKTLDQTSKLSQNADLRDGQVQRLLLVILYRDSHFTHPWVSKSKRWPC